jgi:hypothetical protein
MLLLTGGLCAENLLPNSSFDKVVGAAGWRLVGGKGQWVAASDPGGGALMVEGNGNDECRWETERIRLRPGTLLGLRFSARRDPMGATGVAVAGPSRVNRDFHPTDAWEQYRFVFCVPSDATNEFVRLGQWHVNGKVYFDNVELLPVVPVHRRWPSGLELGEGESIRDGTYRFGANFRWMGANYHRPLVRNRAVFNSNRWLFYTGAELIYRFSVAGGTQTNGILRLAINDYTSGVLRLEASRDNKSWTPVATLDGGRRSGTNALPEVLFPANEIFVRLSLAGPGGRLQVSTLDYDAALAERFTDQNGETRFLEILQNEETLRVQLDQVRPAEAAGAFWFDLTLTNQSPRTLELRGVVALESLPPEWGPTLSLPPKQSGRLTLRAAVVEPDPRLLKLRVENASGQTLFEGRTELRFTLLDDPRPGYLLRGAKELDVAWCETGWKIGRDRPPPPMLASKQFPPVAVSAARGEYEPAQLLLRPERDGSLLAVNSVPFKNDQGELGSITITFRSVAYVPVTQATDPVGAPDWYPDPLPPLALPLELPAGLNQPLWITFHVARDVKPGDYHSELALETSFGNVSVPLRVHVYDFALPVETHLKSAFGLDTDTINRYHGLTDHKEQEEVYGRYLQNFAEHRISPDSWHTYAPIKVRFEGEGTNRHPTVDFSQFDPAATKWLDQYHFSTFKLPLIGMGYLSSRQPVTGQLAGFKEGTAEYAQVLREYLTLVENHVRERGWLDKAYLYWIDEPEPRHYDFVAAGMEHLKAAAPGIRRMLTATPDAKLMGHVDIWCGLLHQWTPASIRERQAAGEEVWWYICTVPKAPYVTEFIDHPGTELRLWPWQSWQFGVSGILVWNTVYWTSPRAYPGPKMQDPWSDPMSYPTGSGLAPGFVGVWGNGDGRFLYPPRGSAGTNTGPPLDGPINSIRWENLRDGIEDYEYFWLLKQAIERAAAVGGNSSLLSEARRLLTVPPEVSRDLTHFTADPRPMLAHRDRLAQMIEKLQKEIAAHQF